MNERGDIFTHDLNECQSQLPVAKLLYCFYMKLLTICSFGKNRSVYLKEYLKSLGYDAKSSGLSDDNLKKKIEESDILIIVHPEIEKATSGKD